MKLQPVFVKGLATEVKMAVESSETFEITACLELKVGIWREIGCKSLRNFRNYSQLWMEGGFWWASEEAMHMPGAKEGFKVGLI